MEILNDEWWNAYFSIENNSESSEKVMVLIKLESKALDPIILIYDGIFKFSMWWFAK